VVDGVQWLALELALLSLEFLLLDSCLSRKAFGRLSLRKRITERLKAFIPVCNSVEKSLADTDEPCCFIEARNMC
jgi:hypothetical protein